MFKEHLSDKVRGSVSVLGELPEQTFLCRLQIRSTSVVAGAQTWEQTAAKGRREGVGGFFSCAVLEQNSSLCVWGGVSQFFL